MLDASPTCGLASTGKHDMPTHNILSPPGNKFGITLLAMNSISPITIIVYTGPEGPMVLAVHVCAVVGMFGTVGMGGWET